MRRFWKAILSLALALPFTGKADPLQLFPDSIYVSAEFNDADSFQVRLQGGDQVEVIRLYFVDSPETSLSSESDRRRVLEQARYFGLEDPRGVIEFGQSAREFVEQQLKKPFTVHTAFARAQGRSKKARIYAMVETADGEDLAKLLVEHGLARAKGIGRQLPVRTPAVDYAAFLEDLEIVAGLKKSGIWAATDPEMIAELRQVQRDEDRQLNEALKFGVFSTVDEDNPIQVNEASAEELQQLSGIGPELAERIVAERPYESVKDLLKVKGIGPATLEKIEPFVTTGE